MKKQKSMSISRVRNLGIIVAIASLTLTVSASASGPAESTLYNFLGHPDGENPAFPVTFDKAGNIYSATVNGGMYGWGEIFQLSPPAMEGGSWTENILYNFQAGSDGANPSSGVLFDAEGNLYGEVFLGSVGRGDVFELTPPSTPSGSWAQDTVYLFCVDFAPCPDGNQPSGGLVFDPEGNIYGTTALGGNTVTCCGIAFKLTKPHGTVTSWTETVLHTFVGISSGHHDGSTPMGGVIRDKEGNVYGTTLDGGDPSACGGKGCGTVFKLSAEGGVWKESILYAFHGTGDGRAPQSGLIFDECGALYGTTSGEGIYNPGNVFKLSPPTHSGGAWTERVLYRFRGLAALDGANPQAGVVFRGKDLYGTTANGGSASCSYGSGNVGCGTVFKLAPPTTGTGPWHETILWDFSGGGSDPLAPLIVRDGALYGTASDGGASGSGTVFEIVP